MNNYLIMQNDKMLYFAIPSSADESLQESRNEHSEVRRSKTCSQLIGNCPHRQGRLRFHSPRLRGQCEPGEINYFGQVEPDCSFCA